MTQNQTTKQKANALKKALVGYGFDKNLIKSIKGDKSLRETVYNREKTSSSIDKNMPELIKIFEYLLLETGAHRLSIGFNNGEVKTFSIFDPANMEVHLASDLLDEDYINENFVKIPLKAKSQFFKRLYQMLTKDEIFKHLSPDWQTAFKSRNEAMKNTKLTDVDELRYILKTLPALRNLDGYFLRTTSIGLFNSTVNMTFNCDGTQIIAHQKFKTFFEEYV